MLAKKYRLTKNKEFEAVMNGKTIYSPVLLIKRIKNKLPFSRFGIIVSNKVSKKANQRNLIKRRIREIIRLLLNKTEKGYDIVIIVSPKIINEQGKVLKQQEIEKNLFNVFKKAQLI